MATKILNLDSFVEVERQVTIKGKTYDIAGKTVGVYLSALSNQERYESLAEREKLELAIDTLRKTIVGIDRSVLEELSFQQIDALMQFVSGIDDPQVGADGEQQGEDQKKA